MTLYFEQKSFLDLHPPKVQFKVQKTSFWEPSLTQTNRPWFWKAKSHLSRFNDKLKASHVQWTIHWFGRIKNQACHHQSSVHPVWLISLRSATRNCHPVVSRVVCWRPVMKMYQSALLSYDDKCHLLTRPPSSLQLALWYFPLASWYSSTSTVKPAALDKISFMQHAESRVQFLCHQFVKKKTYLKCKDVYMENLGRCF